MKFDGQGGVGRYVLVAEKGGWILTLFKFLAVNTSILVCLRSGKSAIKYFYRESKLRPWFLKKVPFDTLNYEKIWVRRIFF